MTGEDTRLRHFVEPALLILDSLANGPKHGYALMTDIESRTDRAIGPGTLYAALARLEARGLVRALPAHDRRRPYELTDEGKYFLSQQLRDLRAFSAAGLKRLARHAR
jgi:DNA-binding PadR family transcriptional regulator